jgi:type I restriction enzyme S subunit
MNKIEQMIAELCPNGVEFKKLGEVCKFQRGTTITAKDAVEGDIPVIAGGQTPAYYHNVPNRTGETISVSSSGAYAGFVAYWTIPVFLSDSFSVNPNPELLLTKYVFYFLKNIQEQIHNSKKGSGVPHVHGSDLAKLEIPIPPLPIQQEIVNILDKFTKLEAELEAELEARRKQYEYYRSKLLTFNEIGGGVLGG